MDTKDQGLTVNVANESDWTEVRWREKYYDKIEELRYFEEKLYEANAVILLLGGMAGTPDAKEGCRNICKVVNEWIDRNKAIQKTESRDSV